MYSGTFYTLNPLKAISHIAKGENLFIYNEYTQQQATTSCISLTGYHMICIFANTSLSTLIYLSVCMLGTLEPEVTFSVSLPSLTPVLPLHFYPS